MLLSTYWIICSLSLIVVVFTTKQPPNSDRMEYDIKLNVIDSAERLLQIIPICKEQGFNILQMFHRQPLPNNKYLFQAGRCTKLQTGSLTMEIPSLFGRDTQFIGNISEALTKCEWDSVGFDNGAQGLQSMIITARHRRSVFGSRALTPARMNLA